MKHSCALFCRPLLIALFIVPSLGFSQVDNSGIYLLDPVGNAVGKGKSIYEDVSGSAYFHDEWLNGDVYLKTKEIYKGTFLKLNFHTQEVHALTKNNAEIILQGETIDRIEIPFKGLRFNFNILKISKDKVTKYLLGEVLVDGEVKLYRVVKRAIITLKDYNSAVSTKKFKESTEYYVTYKDKTEEMVKEKDFFNNFIGGKSDKIEAYFSNKKNKLKKEDDIISFIELLNN